MDELLTRLAECVEKGKADKNTPFPPELKGMDGAVELTNELLKQNVPALEILQKGLMTGMTNIGDKFSKGKAFIPNLLIAAKAMNACTVILKPYFEQGEDVIKGTFILGTVKGDLHDIGKNIVKMVLEGAGWKVVDLGVDVPLQKFVDAVNENPGALVGLSALLSTTMLNMKEIVANIKEKFVQTRVFVGGAPVSNEFSDQIGADGYFNDPYALVKFLG